MSFMDGSAISSKSDYPEKTMPDEVSAIALRIMQLGQDIASNTAGQLELLLRFDELEGWVSITCCSPLSGVDEPGNGHQRSWSGSVLGRVA